jgi:hypothetical protein
VNPFVYADGNPVNLVDPRGLATCFYSIANHTLVCTPDNGAGTTTVGPDGVFSGVGECMNNSESGCTSSKDKGPIKPGKYNINMDDRHPDRIFWRLEPNPKVPGWAYYLTRIYPTGPRGGFMLHDGTHSLGCITIDNKNEKAMTQLRILDTLLKSDSGGVLFVTVGTKQ